MFSINIVEGPKTYSHFIIKELLLGRFPEMALPLSVTGLSAVQACLPQAGYPPLSLTRWSASPLLRAGGKDTIYPSSNKKFVHPCRSM